MPKVPSQLIGESPSFRKALDEAGIAAGQNTPVLLYGETGSGKGIVAEFIHIKSRREGRLVSLNCATFQPNLFESELFGYMKGAFTGALKDTPGLFEAADRGTLFLDEIGDMPLELQPKLLRALEEGVIRRVGGTKEIEVDVRLVCATNQDLQERIDAGKFREDLYYRINSFVVSLPPLRERKEDIAELARHFLRDLHRGGDINPPVLSVEAVEALESYDWPGNVRELRSAMNYAAARVSGGRTILGRHLPDTILGEPEKPEEDAEDSGHMDSFRELYRRGAEDPVLWARFLLAFNRHLGSNKFARGDVLDCLREIRGPEPTNNSLVNEWQRHIKPVPLRYGLVSEEGKKLRINLDACHAVLTDRDSGFELADEDEPDERTETQTAPPPPIRERGGLTNIDAARTSFVGRQSELIELIKLARSTEANLVTLTGPGGTGKTRLSRETGRRLSGEMPGGVWFADLTEARNIEGVAYAVAQALGIPLTGKQSPELVIGDILAARRETLLILDNFEQVAEAASGTLSDWARRAPQVHFLVTSRFLLGIEDEREFNLGALSLPEADDEPKAIAANESVQLFIERARVHHVGFALDAQSAPAVARICRRLEGMPLAIELAAARTVIMKPEQIAARLDRVFDMLKSSRRDLAPRQQSLQATLDWSYELLNDVERWAFAQLSVFRGGFFLEAAERILDLSRFNDPPDPLDIIQSLREKSLLRAFETPYETRFAMYQLIREYAARKWAELAGDVEREAVGQRMAQYFREYLNEWASRVFSRDAVEALDRLDFAHANVAAVLDWAFERRDNDDAVELFVEMTVQQSNQLRVRGPALARVPAIKRALEVVGDRETEAHVRLLLMISLAEREAGDPPQGRPHAERALAMAQRLDDRRLVATAQFNLAGIAYSDGNLEEAGKLQRQALPAFKETGDRLNYGRCLSRMGLTLAAQGNFDDAMEYSRRSEEVLREEDDLTGLAFMLQVRGSMFLKLGKPSESLKQFEAAERIFRELHDKRMVALCIGNRALMERSLRRMDTALALAEEGTSVMRELSDLPSLAKNLMNTGILHVELANYDAAEEMFEEARQLFMNQDRPELAGVCVENLAFIEGKRGNIDEALRVFDNAIKLAEGRDEDLLAGIRNSKAEILIDAGRFSEALPLARAACEYFTAHKTHAERDTFRAATSFATSAQHTGDEPAAQAAAEQALKLAAELGYKKDDPSPLVVDSLKNLERLS